MPETATPTVPDLTRRPDSTSDPNAAADPDDTTPGPSPEHDAPLQSPREFYAEMTRRPDMREILRQLAES